MNELTFSALRRANLTRLPLFRNSRGEPAHSTPDGSDWCLAQWCNAVTGEVGEAANIIKKIERGDMTLEAARPALARELADIQIYLDLLAFRAGVDLAEATAAKWDEVSARVGLPLRIEQFMAAAPAADTAPSADAPRCYTLLPAYQDILAERRRQIEVEGFDAAHDDMHINQMIDGFGRVFRRTDPLYLAAVAYRDHAVGKANYGSDGRPINWPWPAKWWKPKGPRRDLVRAGALALAASEAWARRKHHFPNLHEALIAIITHDIEAIDAKARALAAGRAS